MTDSPATPPPFPRLTPAAQPGLWLALAVYLLCALTYFFIVPIFEAPDEWTHTGHVKYIAEGNGLPVMWPGQGIWGGQQPPLYYSIGALLVQPFELQSFEGYAERNRNPHRSLGYALDPGNKNNYLHTPAESFPYRGLSLTVHILRLYSITFGLITLVFIYLTALELAANQFPVEGKPSPRRRRDSPLPEEFKGEQPGMTKTIPPSIPPAGGEVSAPPPSRGRLGGGRILASPKSLAPYPPLNPKGEGKLHQEPSVSSPNPQISHAPRSTLHSPLSQSPNLPISQSPVSNLQSPISSPQSLLPTLVTLFAACQPMFAFITASVANEPANIAFCAVGLWLAQRYVLYGPSVKPYRAVMLGVVLGLISLSKMTGLSFGLVAVVAMLITAITTRKQVGAARLLWRDGVIIGLLFGLVGGWWYWRNYQLYGDFFQSGLYKIYFNVDPQPLTLSEFLYTLSTGEVSFWATFGWLNITGPEWLYDFYRLLPRVGLIALVMAGTYRIMNYELGIRNYEVKTKAHRPTPAPQPPTPYSLLPTPASLLPLILHLVFPLALAFSLARLVSIEGGIQGRQILPALGSIAIVTLWGWWMILLPRLRLPILGGLMVLMFGLALWLPFGVVARAYHPPALLTEADLPADLPRIDRTFNDEMKLIAVDVGAEVARPGERVPVTVTWQVLKPMTTDYSVFVHLIGRNYESVGQFNTYPALGLRPTTTLEPGQIMVDTYPVLINGGAAAPTRLLVNVGLFNINEAGRPGIPAIDSNGDTVSPTVGQLKLIPNTWPAAPAPPPAEFADSIQLGAADLQNCDGSTSGCTVTFTWLAQAQPTADYTVFIQLWHDGEQIRGFDGPPLAGDYPTPLWANGEVIVDAHSLDVTDLPPGQYRLVAGLYNFQTGERLPAYKDGEPLPDFAVAVGTVEIGD
ncbi:MAG: hypothetical protein KDJ52_21960 [Anaerolineae bacterium]|nr:hypothetical protein [Anaerolineae bacterium]